MGISHPLSDDFDALRAAVLSPDRSPPSSPPPASCCSADEDFLEHQVSRMDTLAGIAIKYGVEISDIKRANCLVTDSQMFAHKVLLIPLPGRPIPFPSLNGSGQRIKRAWAPNNQQSRDSLDKLDSYKSSQQQMSLAMSSLQTYYGLTCQKGGLMDGGTEMSRLSDTHNTDGSRNCEDMLNGATGTKSNGTNKANQDGWVRWRQKVEADGTSNATDTQDDVLSDPLKMIKSILPRPVSSIRLNVETSNPDSSVKSDGSFLSGFKSLRKSPSAPNFADAQSSGGISMWSSCTWTFNHESFTRPLLDGLPKPKRTMPRARRTKAALD
ncbi:hypothetical protein GUJ93_ZPchr0012g19857 [Zizania palustris]|uniref:LysM domain-containing protein n=1 Tax=Zizania palustris TaxID=103762 RepID=A0A8J6BUD5_ZIZPA|nr:hypothetical protein GUJ93_ZPchr0012g19857 [Zizania palustris]